MPSTKSKSALSKKKADQAKPLEKDSLLHSKRPKREQAVKGASPKVRKKDEMGFQQGVLFMDEYETFQDECRGNERRDEAAEASAALPSKRVAPAADQEESESRASSRTSNSLGVLEIKLSSSLHRKLLNKAELEGVSVDEFTAELLAEGLVLRAWEIMERKTAMRGQHPTTNSYQGNSRQANNRHGFRNSNNNYGRGRPGNGNGNSGNHGNGNGNYAHHGNGGAGANGRRMNYNQIMEDSANFLEYVRSQEKKQR